MSGFLPPDFGLEMLLQGNPVTGELALMSSTAFRDACQAGSGPKLADSPAFLKATEGLPEKGISLTFMSPGVNEVLLGFFQASMKAEGHEAEAMGPYLDWLAGGLLADFPVASVMSVEKSGLFTQSNWNASHKRNIATLAYANPVTIGLMAAMAIPAFQKVRATSQEKAITNNLRMLASAAQQMMLEEGVTSVRTEDLIGPDAYIYSFEPVMGESYPEVITAEMTKIEAVLPTGETVTYQF
jgi:type IV pilus assembly protein PilA